MPSRRPPSQRDPAYALHRLAGTIAQAVPGLKVKNATPIRAATPNRKAPAPAAGTAEVRFLYLTVHPDATTLSFPSQSMSSPLSTALARGYQDTGGTFMFAGTGGSVAVGWEAVGGPVSGPSFTDLGYRVHQLADSSGALLTPTVREQMTSGQFISYDAGTGLYTGTGHTGTLFHVDADDSTLQIDVAGLYHVNAFLTWV